MIPELKMQLERQRHLGIVRLASPNPARLSDQRGQVIDWMLVAFFDRLIAQLRRNILRPPHLIARKEKIEIALRAVAWIGNEQRAMAEALEDQRDPALRTRRQTPLRDTRLACAPIARHYLRDGDPCGAAPHRANDRGIPRPAPASIVRVRKSRAPAATRLHSTSRERSDPATVSRSASSTALAWAGIRGFAGVRNRISRRIACAVDYPVKVRPSAREPHEQSRSRCQAPSQTSQKWGTRSLPENRRVAR